MAEALAVDSGLITGLQDLLMGGTPSVPLFRSQRNGLLRQTEGSIRRFLYGPAVEGQQLQFASLSVISKTVRTLGRAISSIDARLDIPPELADNMGTPFTRANALVRNNSLVHISLKDDRSNRPEHSPNDDEPRERLEVFAGAAALIVSNPLPVGQTITRVSDPLDPANQIPFDLELIYERRASLRALEELPHAA